MNLSKLETLNSEKLKNLRLHGMREAYFEVANTAHCELSFDDKLSILAERESIHREDKALKVRVAKAKFKSNAALENVKPASSRGIDNSLLAELSRKEWIHSKRNIVLTGASGCGKTFIATAISHKAVLNGFSARYFRANQLLSELCTARDEGKFRRLIDTLGKINVLIIDDFCLSSINENEEKDLFELIEERHQKWPTVFTSQNPISVWHGLMPNPAIADAILDRLTQQSIRIELKGESLRKIQKLKVDTIVDTN
jgi:DNA replication protein DnaC